MADRPILFSAPMVRALLAGRKTQTRRVLKPQPDDLYEGKIPRQLRIAINDRLWVREAHRFIAGTGSHHWDGAYQYRADMAVKYGKMIDGEEWVKRCGEPDDPWRPSIHMPRWASRITLLVTDVRVQRLQEISEADAIAEGWPPPEEHAITGIAEIRDAYPIAWYAGLWEDLNGPGAWEANPWVAAYSFAPPILNNIDEM